MLVKQPNTKFKENPINGSPVAATGTRMQQNIFITSLQKTGV
jgi:hypothetical protein